MTEALEECGLAPDIVPPHPKMPLLVRSAAEEAAAILARKRRTASVTPAVLPPASIAEKPTGISSK
jgi:hypothetical protein